MDFLWQTIFCKQVTTVSAEINIPSGNEDQGEEDDEETVYTRSLSADPPASVVSSDNVGDNDVTVKLYSPSVVTVDGSVTTDASSATSESAQRHIHPGMDESAPTFNV
ncbi:hypothetical protein SK128_009325 [Halocaridina rubra]|uniref:Uncharacterized protein n=1 Tax=Halocaridina rubra TaxID=373956 RepID=A0AAN8WZA3_HALRR